MSLPVQSPAALSVAGVVLHFGPLEVELELDMELELDPEPEPELDAEPELDMVLEAEPEPVPVFPEDDRELEPVPEPVDPDEDAPFEADVEGPLSELKPLWVDGELHAPTNVAATISAEIR
jgi:hypothetical protein